MWLNDIISHIVRRQTPNKQGNSCLPQLFDEFLFSSFYFSPHCLSFMKKHSTLENEYILCRFSEISYVAINNCKVTTKKPHIDLPGCKFSLFAVNSLELSK